jgi:hypothetical protein
MHEETKVDFLKSQITSDIQLVSNDLSLGIFIKFAPPIGLTKNAINRSSLNFFFYQGVHIVHCIDQSGANIVQSSTALPTT